MPTPTYDLIASNVLSSSASSVTFSSISGSYRDLILVVNAYNYSDVLLRINGDTGSQSVINMAGTGSTTGSSTITRNGFFIGYALNGESSFTRVNIFDYSVTDKHKTLIYRWDNAVNSTQAMVGRWANTAAVTSLEILTASGTFNSGSTFYLYGIVS